METYHKIQTLFKRDMTGEITGQKGKMIEGQWTTPELEYLADNEWEFTEKVDGTNIRIGINRVQDIIDVKFGGRTERASIPAPLTNWLTEHFPSSAPWRRDPSGKDALIYDWMNSHRLEEAVLFGEGYGIDIQNGGNYAQSFAPEDGKQKFVLFDVKIGNWWLDRDSVNAVAQALEIDSVPVIGYGTLGDGIAVIKGDTRRRVELWDDEEEIFQKQYIPGKMKSTWGDFLAEGIVARPTVPMFDRKGERIITKIKEVDFR